MTKRVEINDVSNVSAGVMSYPYFSVMLTLAVKQLLRVKRNKLMLLLAANAPQLV